MSPLLFVEDLFKNYNQNHKETIMLLRSTMLWVIPCMNPDTYDYNVEKFAQSQNQHKNSNMDSKYYGSLRKNLRDTCPRASHKYILLLFLTCRKIYENGVDLNRNFPICFDVDEKGSSSNACSDIYRVGGVC